MLWAGHVVNVADDVVDVVEAEVVVTVSVFATLAIVAQAFGHKVASWKRDRLALL